jgi:hypothetical protein
MVGANQALARLSALPDAVNSAVARTVADLGGELQQRVQDKLSGQSFQPRSGKLRSSIDLKVDRSLTEMNAVASTDLDYGRTQEFGFAGVVGVKASLRRIREAFGRPIAEKTINIRAYRRRFDLPGRSFLASALDETTPDISAEIDAALHEALAP